MVGSPATSDPRTGDARPHRCVDSWSMRHLASSRAAALALLVVTAAFSICAVEFTFHFSDALRHALNDWVSNTVMLAAGAVCIVRGVLYRRDRLAWILMGTAVAVWGIGDTVWTFTVA